MKRLLPLLLFVAACAAVPGKPAERDIFNAGLRQAWANEAQTMAAVRPPLRFANGHTVRDCHGYLTEQARAAVDEAVNNRGLAQAYLVCDALALLDQAKALPPAATQASSYGHELLQRLDLRSFPSSLRPRLGETFTLAAIGGAVPQVETHAVTLETEDWRYRFEVIADIVAADGGREWLVWFSDEAKAGNYRGYATLRLPVAAAHGPLVARP
ncbi:hypothetical protein [Azonexus sp.]|uniref:hypothetical protein n=1 Tax=Azonexus sp. TaxID=1872668 RepID=UPI0035B23E92